MGLSQLITPEGCSLSGAQIAELLEVV